MPLRSLVIASFAASASAFGDGLPPVEAAFAEFVQTYGRRYDSEVEQKKRFDIFAGNYAFINAENAKGNNSYELAVNDLADQSPDEVASEHTGLGPLPLESIMNNSGLAYLGPHNYSGMRLPKTVDWVKRGAVTPVKNQGQCGGCWSFATTGSLEGAWEIATGKLVSLSEQQLVDCSSRNHGCNGGNVDLALMYLEGTALCTESAYPYRAKQGTCHHGCRDIGIPKGSIRGFHNVMPENLGALMEAVFRGPVAVAIQADQKAFQLYHRGVLSRGCGTKLDHAVLLVGYGVVQIKSKTMKYWLVKNSWGNSWGLHGYVRLERGFAGPGVCGIKDMPVYPVVAGRMTEKSVEETSIVV